MYRCPLTTPIKRDVPDRMLECVGHTVSSRVKLLFCVDYFKTTFTSLFSLNMQYDCITNFNNFQKYHKVRSFLNSQVTLSIFENTDEEKAFVYFSLTKSF